eukprot:SAG25_NODE_20_length_23237_cov_58.179229_28_plen_544_part_00
MLTGDKSHQGLLVTDACAQTCGKCSHVGVCVDDPVGLLPRMMQGFPKPRNGGWTCALLGQAMNIDWKIQCDKFIVEVSAMFAGVMPPAESTAVLLKEVCPVQCGTCACQDGFEVVTSAGSGAGWQCKQQSAPRYQLSRLVGCLARADILQYIPNDGGGNWGTFVPGPRATVPSVPTSKLPCRRACAACDLGVVCQSLLLHPIQQWTTQHTLKWLLDDTVVGSLPVVHAFIEGQVDGKTLSALVGSDKVLARHMLDKLGIHPLSAVKDLLEVVETYAFPRSLDRSPSPQSCSRLVKPLLVHHTITITDLFAVDDVNMQFEVALLVDTVWQDDRVLYIPSSTDAELESCERPCFDTAANVIEEGSEMPPEAVRCCDKMWVPRVSYTNAKELTVTKHSQIVWKERKARMRTSLRGVFKQTMLFSRFPYDQQKLTIAMQLSENVDDVALQPSTVQLSDEQGGCPGWIIMPSSGAGVSRKTKASAAGDDKAAAAVSAGAASFHVQRLHSHFVDNYMSSMIMLVVLSWYANFTIQLCSPLMWIGDLHGH